MEPKLWVKKSFLIVGRIRNVVSAPDGSLVLAIDSAEEKLLGWCLRTNF
ncbi:MAG: hypothetical protein Ct9H300mP3_00360 [Gammaproteobacteria bacterium]|nr:MAG: hypothetical protein Ct9H300mP3_00360 [Gammaproteobacteria bacterium]